jgi:hypothetical protein
MMTGRAGPSGEPPSAGPERGTAIGAGVRDGTGSIGSVTASTLLRADVSGALIK